MSLTRQPNSRSRWEPTELASTILSAPSRQVIRSWVSSGDFLDEHNDPVMLMIDHHAANSFRTLVQATSPDFAPTVVLNELLRKGVVETLDSGYLMLKRSVYAPSQPRRVGGARRDQVFESRQNIPRRRYDDVI